MRNFVFAIFCLVLAEVACAHQSPPVQPARQIGAVVEVSPSPTTSPSSPTLRAAAPPPSGPEAIYFALDDALVQPEASPVLQDIGRRMMANPQSRVRIEGNCDERGTTEYNLALGDRRARAAQHYLIRLGIQPSRIEIVTYGSERPRTTGHDEAAWAQNRRDDLIIN